MIFTYLKISFRHLQQNKVYAGIHILGMGMAVCMVLLAILYLKDEWTYDRFHHNGDRLYRITTSMVPSKGERIHTSGGTGQVQGPAFKAEVPELENYTRILGGDIFGEIMA